MTSPGKSTNLRWSICDISTPLYCFDMRSFLKRSQICCLCVYAEHTVEEITAVSAKWVIFEWFNIKDLAFWWRTWWDNWDIYAPCTDYALRNNAYPLTSDIIYLDAKIDVGRLGRGNIAFGRQITKWRHPEKARTKGDQFAIFQRHFIVLTCGLF